MKIHEQEWTLDAFGDVCRGLESLAAHTNATPDEMRAMAAAPKMARALLAVREAFPPPASEEESDALEAVLDALRSAGVL